jgi:hypothetical protein
VLDRRYRIARFNAQERYNRRLWVSEMKAVWDFQRLISGNKISHSSQDLDDVKMQQDLEYASYLDYINDKLVLYDEDYRTRATAFKNAMTDHDDERPLTAQERFRIDFESRLRQSRTQELWKGLARLRDRSDQLNSSDQPRVTRHPPSLRSNFFTLLSVAFFPCKRDSFGA